MAASIAHVRDQPSQAIGLQSLRGPGPYYDHPPTEPDLPSVLPFAGVHAARGFHRYQPVGTPGLLPGDAVFLRSEPSSRTSLMGEQPNPWDLLQPQDEMSRHRGAKQGRRCGLLDPISLLSPG